MKHYIYIVNGFYMVLCDAEVEFLLQTNSTKQLVKEVSMHAAKMYYAFFKQFPHTSAEQADALFDWSAE